jgi:signal transduction histidine kinase
MTDADWLVPALRPVPAFAGLSDDDVAWLAERMVVMRADAGELVVRPGEPADMMVVVLDGELCVELDHMPYGATYVLRPGDITGALPYSRLTNYQLSVRAMEPSRFACLRREWFPELLHRFPTLAQWLVSAMADRIRLMTTIHERQRRLEVLGKLSSVLAHELHEPAIASCKAARKLLDLTRRAAEHTRQLDDLTAPADARAALADAGDASAVERSREQLGPLFDPARGRAAALAAADASLGEIEHAVIEISQLVAAVKTYSYMDKEPVQEVDVHQGLDATLTLLRHYLKKGVTLTRDFDSGLPHIIAHGGELNLIWTSLLATALRTMKGKGKLRVQTSQDGDRIVVGFAFDGPEMPQEIQQQLRGELTATIGLETPVRLNAVSSIIHRHMGELRLESRPGATRIEVRLPVENEAGRTATGAT